MAEYVDPKVVERSLMVAVIGLFILLFAFYPELKQRGLLGKPDSLEASKPKEAEVYYKVTKVTDGDTIHIKAGDTDEKVRLIGINTPEVSAYGGGGQCFGEEAKKGLEDILGGKIVRLETDGSQDLRDSYGRVLAYVYLEDGQMANRKMIASGYAYEYTYLKPYRFQKEFRGLQTFARTSGYGLWATSTCKGMK